MRAILITLAATILGSSAALSADDSHGSSRERSYGFIHVASNGEISQSLSARRAGRGYSVSGGSYRGDRDGRRNDRFERRGYSDIDHRGSSYRPRGSFIYVSQDVNPADRPYIPSLDDVAYGGSGTYDFAYGSSRGYGYGDGDERPGFPSGTKIINIRKERLDKRPIGPSGIDVVSTGGAKIIRIAPGYSSTGQRQASAEPKEIEQGYLTPWSEAWTKHCIKAFASFNPELGTYRDSAGKTRFCTAE